MLIAIDGIDGSGKGTQTNLIREYLESRGKRVDYVSFPQYSSFFGSLAGQYLNGEYGTLEQVHPKLAALLYAMDRRDYFEKHDLKGDIILCDRYVPSNIGHQAARMPREERDAFVNWLEELEFQINHIPRPDLSLIFDLSVENSALHVAKKQKRAYTDLTHDIHEQDRDYLSAVREYFLSLSEREGYRIVRCEGLDGTVRPIEDIFHEVKGLIAPLLERS